MNQRTQSTTPSASNFEEKISISKQERLFLNSVASVYSRKAYSYFLHNYLKQVSYPSLEGEEYKDRPINRYALHMIGVDPGFGSSKTAIVLTELMKEEQKIKGIIR